MTHCGIEKIILHSGHIFEFEVPLMILWRAFLVSFFSFFNVVTRHIFHFINIHSVRKSVLSSILHFRNITCVRSKNLAITKSTMILFMLNAIGRFHENLTAKIAFFVDAIGFERNKRNKRSTGLLLRDIEKAFDSVWHNGLIYKLNTYGVPKYLLRILKSFVTERKFQVAIGNTLSSFREIPAGLPQGSVLSPLLYCIFISDFKKPKYCEMSYYADDTGIIAEGKHTKTVVKRLQGGLKACNKYLKKWKIQLNVQKTQAIIFPYNNSPKRKPESNLVFDGNVI